MGWCVHGLTPLRCAMGRLISSTTYITEFILEIEVVSPESGSDVWHVALGVVLFLTLDSSTSGADDLSVGSVGDSLVSYCFSCSGRKR
jgi:hypothetical protein